MNDIASYIPSEDLGVHPAVRAWSRLCSKPARPRGLEVLRAPREHGHKPCIFRITGLGCTNSSIVAKLCLKETAQFERLIYETVLPDLPLPRLEFYGTVESEDPAKDWVFVEDAGDERYSPKLEAHRQAASEWIALLHTSAENLPALQLLPDRGPGHYLAHLHSARTRIQASRSNPAITLEQHRILDRVEAYLQLFENSWYELEQQCSTMPMTFAHGDWAGRNARFRSAGGRHTLVVFDWEKSGRGVPAVDLASSRIYTSLSSLRAYSTKVRQTWPAMGFEDILRMTTIGRIFRVIAAIDWASVGLVFEQFDYLIMLVSQMQSYLGRIEDVLRESRLPFGKSSWHESVRTLVSAN
jgi:Phosphotransferase enzyme family